MSKALAAPFAQRLRAARQARKWTQAELAERADIAVEVYGRLERGRALPRADTLVNLASALGTTTDDLLGLGGAVAQRRHVSEQQAEYGDSTEFRRLVRRLRRESRRTIHLLDALVSSMRTGGSSRGRGR